MVIDRGEVKVDWCIFDAVVGELVLDALHNVALDIELVVVRQSVHFVDEYFDVDVGVGGLKVEDCAVQAIDGFEVFVLGVDDPDQGTNFAENRIEVEGGVKKIKLAWEVPNLEIHEGAVDVSAGEN